MRHSYAKRMVSRRQYCIIFLSILLITAFVLYMCLNKKTHLSVERVTFNTEKVISFDAHHGALRIDGGMDYSLTASQVKCQPSTSWGESACVGWGEEAQLELTSYADEGAHCSVVTWQSLSSEHVPHDCIHIGEHHWYGGSETHTAHWPIQTSPILMQQYLSTDIVPIKGTHGSVLERYWLASNGIAIFVEDDVPLHVGIDNEKLCFIAKYGDSWYRNPANELPKLNYTVCSKESVLDIHLYMSSKRWQKPSDIPGERIFRDPIWSTWAQFKTSVDQEKVMKFANSIKENGFTASQVEIDDVYTSTYGDFVFDPVKFPHPKNMTALIHNLGFHVSSWVTPFANIESDAFIEGVKHGYWVMDKMRSVPILVKWWQGIAGLLDVTNPLAVEWFFKRLHALHEAGVDTFKYDAGECTYFPIHGDTYQPLLNPNYYSTHYATVAYKNTNKDLEVRVGYKTQHLPIFVRMMDLYSTWGADLGLKSMIPTVLQLSIEGYFFILPDMVGGNAYGVDVFSIHGALPEKELYIRWLQLTIFLPAVQFSIAPWQYDGETIAICHKMMELRKNHITAKLIQLAKESVHTGKPIIRPLWWLTPSDPMTFDIDSEFLIGNDILVAPILEKDHNSRDIYLPEGIWHDKLRGSQIMGRRMLKDYVVELGEVAYFERIS